MAGHRGDAGTALASLASVDPRVREVAVGALARLGALDVDTVVALARSDPDPAVRRRACDAAALLGRDGRLVDALRAALGDPDPLVVEAACWSLGELAAAESPPAGAVRPSRAPEAGERDDGLDSNVDDVLMVLGSTARSHPDARAREAAVAALGAIGDERGLPAVLAALGDRPSVRRRAVVALAAFEGDEVLAALQASATDRDWQVREVAEILLED